MISFEEDQIDNQLQTVTKVGGVCTSTRGYQKEKIVRPKQLSSVLISTVTEHLSGGPSDLKTLISGCSMSAGIAITLLTRLLSVWGNFLPLT